MAHHDLHIRIDLNDYLRLQAIYHEHGDVSRLFRVFVKRLLKAASQVDTLDWHTKWSFCITFKEDD